jgi:hypothetical protein
MSKTYTYSAELVSDLHKDARGFRPSQDFWDVWNIANDDVRQSIWDDLLVDLKLSMAEEERAQKRAVDTFDATMELIQLTMDLDRDAALVRYVEGLGLSKYDLMYGGEYVCYHCNFPYSMAAMFEPAVKARLSQIEMEEAVDAV